MDSAESSRLNEQPHEPEVTSTGSTPPPLGPKSIGRRISVGFARFLIIAFIAVLTGVAASSAWDSHSGEVKQIVRGWASSLISLANQHFTQAEPTADQGRPSSAVTSERDAQQASGTQNQPAAEMTRESMQQLQTISHDLVLIRDRLEQLAITQEQMTKKVASLQATEQEIKQKLSSPTVSAAAPAVPPPVDPRKNAPKSTTPQQSAQLRVIADWSITGSKNGYVFVEGNDDIYEAAPGVPLPGLGLVKRIISRDGRLAVVTAKGVIVSKRDRKYFDNLKELEN